MIPGLIHPTPELEPGVVGLIGVPWDENSSHLRGSADGPSRIREALFSGASSLTSESGVDLRAETVFRDLGDLELPSAEGPMARIEEAAGDLVSRRARVLALGGDHAVTYPLVRGFARHYPELNVLQFDAHPDLYDVFEGNRISHACPFARIMEEGLARRLVQVGIRSVNSHQREQAERFGVELFEMRAGLPPSDLGFDGPLYISFDLDALDPAHAPGVAHPEPGGLTTRQALTIIHGLRAPVVGADIVELNPSRDPLGLTAVVGAKLVKEMVGMMVESQQ